MSILHYGGRPLLTIAVFLLYLCRDIVGPLLVVFAGIIIDWWALISFPIVMLFLVGDVLRLSPVRRLHQIFQDWSSNILEMNNLVDPKAAEKLRRAMMDHPVVYRKDPPNHTHPKSASARSAAVNHMCSLANLLGIKTFFVQMSKQDQQRGRPGSRDWRFPKDLQSVPISETPLEDVDALCYVDVDMYLDMPAALCENAKIQMISTFQPSAVANSDGEYAFTFDKYNVSKVSVSGGGMYTGLVWNYSQDSLLVTRKFLGVPYSCAAYLVDRKTVTENYDLVLLSPLGSWGWKLAWLAWWTISGPDLRRLSLHDDGFLRMAVHKKDGMYMSTGRPDSYACATIPAAVDAALSDQVLVQKADLTSATVQGRVGPGFETGAPVVAAYHRKQRRGIPDRVCPVDLSIQHVQFGPKSEDDFKPLIVPFMTPLIEDGCFAPAVTIINEEVMVKERITNMAKTTVMDAYTRILAEEFVQFLFPRNGVLVPLDFDAVVERQHRPSQLALIGQADDVPHRPPTATNMMKHEAYAKITPPRAITIIDPPDKVAWSLFLYALGDYAKYSWPWYQPGMTPLETAERIVAICSLAEDLKQGDYNRMDGTISPANRELESMVIVRAFVRDVHERALELANSQVNMAVRCRLGTKYQSGTARGSGSPETGLFNTINTAFNAYCAFRSEGVPPIVAYEMLGIYCGDDSATPSGDCCGGPIPRVSEAALVRAASKMGQELEVTTVKRGSVGVKFLARLYGPDVWFGDPNSMCDLKRQLSKLHTTVALPSKVTPLMKAVEKARAFGLTDANTPVLGEWCRTVLRKFPNVYSDYLNIWGSKLAYDVQYPNEDSGWMFALAQSQLPEFDFGGFRDWIRHVDYLGVDSILFLQSPVFMRHQAPVNRIVVVNGELLQPEVPTQGSVTAKPDDKGKEEEVGETQPSAAKAPVVGTPSTDGAPPAAKSAGPAAKNPQNRAQKRAERSAKFGKRAQAAKKAPPKPKGKGKGVT
jgi:hypothetical protein